MAVSPLPELSGKLAIDVVRRLRAIDSEFSTLYATNGTLDTVTITNLTIGDTLTINNDMILADDFYSTNWNGTIPLSLPDAAASLGFALDGATGEAQFQNIYADGGTLGTLSVDGDLTLNGGAIKTDTSGNKALWLTSTGLRAYDATDTYVGGMWIDAITDNVAITAAGGASAIFDTDVRVNELSGDIKLRNATDIFELAADTAETVTANFYIQSNYSGGTANTWELMGPDTAGQTKPVGFYGVLDTLSVVQGPTPSTGTQIQKWNANNSTIEMAWPLEQADGSESDPAYSFGSDDDTGFYRSASGIVRFTSDGADAMQFDDGTLTLYGLNGSADEGGQINFVGGTSYGTTFFLDRYQNNMRFVYGAAEKIRLSSAGDITGVGALRAGSLGGTLTAGSLYSIPQTSSTGAPGVGSQAKWILATGSTYYLARYTSSARYKRDIKPWDGREKVTDIDVMSFIGANRKPVLDEDGEVLEWVEEWGDTPVIGAIAEQVAEVYPQAAVYDEDGRPESIDTDAVLWGMLHEIKQLRYEAEQWKMLKVGECRCSCRST